MIAASIIALAAALTTPVAKTSSSPPVPVKIDAGQVQYQSKDRKVVFIGAPLVRLTRAGAVLLCRRLVAENDQEGQIQRAVCTGDVKLTRGERIVTCDQATFDNVASTVVCIGNPVLREGRSVMYGTQLTYEINEDRTVLTKAHGTVIPKGNEIPKKKRVQEKSP